MNCVQKASRTLVKVQWQSAPYSPLSIFAARVLFALLIVSILYRPAWSQSQASTDCKDRAPLPPLATFGGPATTAPDHTELGLAVGAFGEGIGGSCAITDVAGASDWLMRWRRGIASRTDLGFDLLISDQADETIDATTKIAGRYQATPGLRLEGGIGAADGGDGRSVNADVAAVIGTYKHLENPWNYYTSIRLAGSHGCINLLCLPTQSAPGGRPPGALVPLGVIGATARVSDVARFVMEAGLGGIFSREQPTSGIYFHLSFGVRFNVGRDRERAAGKE